MNRLTRRAFLASAVGPPRPHLVLFLADDHGWGIAGCYGNRAVKTPNLDGFAQEGLRFTHAFAASPTCSPSRACLYTGLHSARNGLMGNHTGAREGLRSIAQHLGALGYRTVLANKTHVSPKTVFDFEYVNATLPSRADRPRRYRQEGLDPEAIDRLLAEHARSRPDQPLCLILADNCPHVTWEANRDYDAAQLPLPPIAADTPKTRAALANYYQEITTADSHFGAVLASLKKHGFDRNALTIYTSDQGPEWPRSKWTCYDAGLRVPFVVRWPGRVRPGTVTDAMISFVDVMATLVDAAGGPAPAGLDGSSFLGVLLGRQKHFREELYASHSGDGTMNMFPQRCIRDRRFKYILNLHPERKWTTHFTQVMDIPGSHGDIYATWLEKARRDPATARLIDRIENHPREELYDTKTDPYELENLAAAPRAQAVLEKMRTRMQEMRRRLSDPDE